MHSIPAVLFPHALITQRQLERILSLFGPLKVFVPFQMSLPDILAGGLPPGLVEIRHPPEGMDPGADLKQALNEYLSWLQANPDRSGLGFLKTGTVPEQGEDSVWRIRQHIRQGGMTPSNKDTAESFRNHLLLHLENEFEQLRGEAGRILSRLKEFKSPLKGLAEDSEEIDTLFRDLPGFEWPPETGPGDPYPVMKAWLGLFGSLLEPGDLLISPDHRYVEFLTELRTEAAEPPDKPPEALRLAYPDLSGRPLEDIAAIRRERLSGEAVQELRTLLLEKAGRPGTDQDYLSRRTAELTGLPIEGPLEETVILKAVFLPPLPDTTAPAGKRSPPPELLGRTIIYLED